MKQILTKMNTVAAYVAAMSVIIILLVTSIDMNCFNKSFYADEYQKLDTAQTLGMTDHDLNQATFTLLDYLQGDRDDIKTEIQLRGTKTEAFNAKEASHMVDVKDLYHFALILRNVSIAAFILSVIYLIVQTKQGTLTHLSIAYMKTAILFAVFVIMLGIWAYADFDAFWTSFHHLAFRNDLWLLNPVTDLMINLFPSAFFSTLVFRIILGFAIGFGGLFLLGYLYLRRKLHKVHQEFLENGTV